VTATRLAITAFIVPYIFAFNPAMLLIDTNAFEVIRIAITSFIGIFGVAAGMEGYMFTNLKVWERAVVIIGGLMLIDPNIITDVAGVAIIGLMVLSQIAKSKKLKLA
jgi:TRAP-type uncharacterized transport system fused permease subunit